MSGQGQKGKIEIRLGVGCHDAEIVHDPDKMIQTVVGKSVAGQLFAVERPHDLPSRGHVDLIREGIEARHKIHLGHKHVDGKSCADHTHEFVDASAQQPRIVVELLRVTTKSFRRYCHHQGIERLTLAMLGQQCQKGLPFAAHGCILAAVRLREAPCHVEDHFGVGKPPVAARCGTAYGVELRLYGQKVGTAQGHCLAGIAFAKHHAPGQHVERIALFAHFGCFQNIHRSKKALLHVLVVLLLFLFLGQTREILPHHTLYKAALPVPEIPSVQERCQHAQADNTSIDRRNKPQGPVQPQTKVVETDSQEQQ